MKSVDVEEVIKKRKFDKEMAFWKESEWTFTKILQRIVGYSLALLFLALGVLIFFEGDWTGIFYFGTCFAISWTYIKNDIEILRTKRKMRKKNNN